MDEERSRAAASRGWLGSWGTRRWMQAAVALGGLLALPSLAVGFCTDDHAFRAFLKWRRPHDPAFWDLYRFTPRVSPEVHEALVRKAILPWWSAVDFKLHLMRPLSSALFALDDAVFGDHAAGYHLHAIAWYVLLLAGVGVLYRSVLPAPSALVGLLVFALEGAHAHAYAWVSARHIVVASAASVVALVARTQSERPALRRWGPPLALVVGLLGGETALGGAAFLLAYELLGPASGRTSRQRLLDAAPVAAITVVYLVLYRLAGAGASGSGAYDDPFASPATFARDAALRVPVLVGDALFCVPSGLTDFVPAGPLAAAGVAAAVFCGLLAYAVGVDPEERTALRWLLPGALAACLVGAAGFPGGRVLALPDVGFAALLGILVHRAFEARGGPARRGGLALAGGLLVLLHAVVAPVLALRTTARLAGLARATERVAHDAELAQPSANRAFLIASDPIVYLYPRGVFAEEDPGRIRCWSVLSAARASHRLTRTSARTFTLEPLGRPLLEGPFERLFRGPGRPFAAGDAFRQCGLDIRVAAVTDGKPSLLEIESATPLDAPDLTFLVWRSGKLRRLDPPEVGQSVDLAWEPGPSRVL